MRTPVPAPPVPLTVMFPRAEFLTGFCPMVTVPVPVTRTGKRSLAGPPLVRQLHRDQLGVSAGQGSLFSPEPAPVCRKSQAKERIEWQADHFASALLMPRTLVMAAWRDRFGDAKLRLVRRRRHPRQRTPGDTPDLDRLPARLQNQDDARLEQFARPLADDFEVSAVAMRIRLEQLSLLHRQVPRQGRLIAS